MGADCTYICANAPSPSQPAYARIDDAYADRYRSRHGKEVDRLSVLLALRALQGHPEIGILWEKLINKFLDDLDIVFTTHKRSVYRDKIDGSSFYANKSTTSLPLAPTLRWHKAGVYSLLLCKSPRSPRSPRSPSTCGPFSSTLGLLHRGRHYRLKIARLPSTWPLGKNALANLTRLSVSPRTSR
jgi:hypothetical protein